MGCGCNLLECVATHCILWTDVAVRQDHRETRKRVAAQLDTLIAAGVRHAVRCTAVHPTAVYRLHCVAYE